MSMIHCERCDHIFDSDYDTECPKCYWPDEDPDRDDLRHDAEERRQERLEEQFHPSEGRHL